MPQHDLANACDVQNGNLLITKQWTIIMLTIIDWQNYKVKTARWLMLMMLKLVTSYCFIP